jgi:hypothetical protein
MNIAEMFFDICSLNKIIHNFVGAGFPRPISY